MEGTRYEEYLEAIYGVVQQKGYAKVNDVAKAMSVSLASTTEMFQRLSADGYINYQKYSGVTLTEKGKAIASELHKKHEVLREFLIILGLDATVADDEACKIEHIVQPETLDLLTRFVEFMESKGNPKWLEQFKEYCTTGSLPECERTPEE